MLISTSQGLGHGVGVVAVGKGITLGGSKVALDIHVRIHRVLHISLHIGEDGGALAQIVAGDLAGVGPTCQLPAGSSSGQGAADAAIVLISTSQGLGHGVGVVAVGKGITLGGSKVALDIHVRIHRVLHISLHIGEDGGALAQRVAGDLAGVGPTCQLPAGSSSGQGAADAAIVLISTSQGLGHGVGVVAVGKGITLGGSKVALDIHVRIRRVLHISLHIGEDGGALAQRVAGDLAGVGPTCQLPAGSSSGQGAADAAIVLLSTSQGLGHGVGVVAVGKGITLGGSKVALDIHVRIHRVLHISLHIGEDGGALAQRVAGDLAGVGPTCQLPAGSSSGQGAADAAIVLISTSQGLGHGVGVVAVGKGITLGGSKVALDIHVRIHRVLHISLHIGEDGGALAQRVAGDLAGVGPTCQLPAGSSSGQGAADAAIVLISTSQGLGHGVGVVAVGKGITLGGSKVALDIHVRIHRLLHISLHIGEDGGALAQRVAGDLAGVGPTCQLPAGSSSGQGAADAAIVLISTSQGLGHGVGVVAVGKGITLGGSKVALDIHVRIHRVLHISLHIGEDGGALAQRVAGDLAGVGPPCFCHCCSNNQGNLSTNWKQHPSVPYSSQVKSPSLLHGPINAAFICDGYNAKD